MSFNLDDCVTDRFGIPCGDNCRFSNSEFQYHPSRPQFGGKNTSQTKTKPTPCKTEVKPPSTVGAG